LVRLHQQLREHTRRKYGRINPFYEDLFDWKERGAYWCDEDRNITIYNSTTVVGNVEIGDNTWVGPYCSLDGSGGLKIGRFCSISLGVQFLSHDTVKWALSGGRLPYEYAPIKIGDCCFIGTHAIITKGATIGDNCVIGAGAVVTDDVPSFSIMGGVPARRIGVVELSHEGNVALRRLETPNSER
jgi:acetyltransferase-like isoleucine patch superfamily enzyme